MAFVRTVLVSLAVLAANIAPVAAAVPLDSHKIVEGAGDILLGAGAATALMAGMTVVVALSWRSFRDSAFGGGKQDRDPFDWHDEDA